MKVRVFNLRTNQELGECEIVRQYAGDLMLSRKEMRRFELERPNQIQQFLSKQIDSVTGWLKGKGTYFEAALVASDGDDE